MRIRTVRDLSTAVRGRRTDVGWSQHGLAERAKVSRAWLARLELGRPSAELPRLLALLDALGLALDVSTGDEIDDRDRRRPRAEGLDLDEHLRRYEP